MRLLRVSILGLLLSLVLVHTGIAQKITYAYLPQYSAKESLQRHRLLVEYLKAETGLEVEQVFPKDFDDHMDKVGSGEIDISYSNPFVYVKIAHRHDAQAFTRVIEKEGAAKFRGEICVPVNSPLQAVADLSGKRILAVSKSSAGGHLFQRGMLVDAGLNPAADVTIDFAKGVGGKQEKAFMGMYSGVYDACFIREGTRTGVMKDKVDISKARVLAPTPWYPGWVYATRKGLDPSAVAKIKEAMLKLDIATPKHKQILGKAKFVKIIEAKDKDFDEVRELATKLQMQLAK